MIEEDDPCPHCDGVMYLPPVENCWCHISAPCTQCTSNVPECNKCGWTESEGLAADAFKFTVEQVFDYAHKAHGKATEIELRKLVGEDNLTPDQVLDLVSKAKGIAKKEHYDSGKIIAEKPLDSSQIIK